MLQITCPRRSKMPTKWARRLHHRRPTTGRDNGGYSRGADKRTGYGTSSLRVWVPSWNAELVSLSAHGSRAAREGCTAGAGISGGLGNGADDGGAGGVVRG